MSKVLAFLSHNASKRDSIISDVWRMMAASDKDGYSAFWFDRNGNICYYKCQLPYIPRTKKLPSFIERGFEESKGAEIESDGGFLVIFSRTSYTNKNSEHTAPFFFENEHTKMALANIGWAYSSKYKHVKCASTNSDGELLSQAYLNDKVKGLENDISGSYSFCALVNNGERNLLELHVATGINTPMHFGFVFKDSIAISSDPSLIEPFKNRKEVRQIRSKTIHIYNSKDIKKVLCFDYEPRQFSYSSPSESWRSHYNIDDDDAFAGTEHGYNHQAPAAPKTDVIKTSANPMSQSNLDKLKRKAIGERVAAGDVIKYYLPNGGWDKSEEIKINEQNSVFIGMFISEDMEREFNCEVYTPNTPATQKQATFLEDTSTYAG